MTPVHRRRVAAIDCGTNAVRLLVADLIGADGVFRLDDVHRETRIVRLGEGVDATGRLTTGAIDRTWSALADYIAIIRASGAVGLRMAATSATRDAANRRDFVDMVQRTIGQDPEVITGDQEAALSFRGAIGDLDPGSGPFLMADIGGGSTELMVGSSVGDVTAADVSLDIGSVRITERLLHSDPPTKQEISDAERWTDHVLRAGLDELPLHRVRRVVAVSGTATTVAAAALKRRGTPAGDAHLAEISRAEIAAATRLMLTATRAHRAGLPYLHPGRVDIIGGGALILHRLAGLLAERTGIEVITTSEHDMLDGLARSLGDR